MNEFESLTDEAKNKIVAKAFAQRDSARRRSRKAALDKCRAGMKRVMVWVPGEKAEQIKQEAARLCLEFARPTSRKPEGRDPQDDGMQTSLFEPPKIEWKLNGQSV